MGVVLCTAVLWTAVLGVWAVSVVAARARRITGIRILALVYAEAAKEKHTSGLKP
jgi:hypothetical protein